MKRIVSLLFALCLLCSLGIPALAEGAAPRKRVVTELYSLEGSYTDSVGNTEGYSFHVPQLNVDTEAAAEINGEIAERFGERVENQLEGMAGGYSIWCWNSEWHAYWYGSQLFLMLSADIEGGFTDIAAYGYDFEKECRVDNAMILDELDVSEEEYLRNLEEKVGLMFDSKYGYLPEEKREELGCAELRKKTLSWLDLEQPMYIDGSGQIVTIVKIASIAGADWYYHLATPFSYG